MKIWEILGNSLQLKETYNKIEQMKSVAFKNYTFDACFDEYNDTESIYQKFV
jgi:hypothetical protein